MRFRSPCRSLVAIAVLLATGCAALKGPDERTVYLERFERVMANGGILPAYEPQEPLAGAMTPARLPFADADDLTVSVAALNDAVAYVEANRSDALIVWHKGKIQIERYFNDVTMATPLVSKSLSKPITAIAVGRAIQMGVIESLDQPVADYIVEWQGTDKAAIKVRHLLDMRSGLLAQGYSRDPDSPWNRAYLSPRHGDYIVNHYPLQSPPGDQFLYSNATSDLVAVLIERATGTRYGDFVSEQILKKIGADGGSLWVNREGGMAHSGCCKFLPARTYFRLALLLMEDGTIDGARLLPSDYVDEMVRGTVQNPHYGLGIWAGAPYTERRGFTGKGGPGPQVLHSEPYIDPDTFLFDGNSNQVVYVLPAYEMIVLRLGKTPPKSPEWDNSYLPNRLVRGIQADNID